MDNFYISTKISRACYITAQKVITHSITQSSGRGLSKCIEQQEVTRKEDPARQRGTLKVAQLEHDSACKRFLAISLYDQKPVYVLSNSCDKVEWIKKERAMLHTGMGEMYKCHSTFKCH